MQLPTRLVLAWVLSSSVFAVAGDTFLGIVGLIGGRAMPVREALRVGALILVLCLCIQIVYGTFLYFALRRFAIFRWWIVVLCYVFPVLVFSAFASDTPSDVLGTVPWVIYAILVGLTFWAVISAGGRATSGG